MTTVQAPQSRFGAYAAPWRPAITRQISDADGKVWRVVELVQETGARALVFDSDGIFRRIREFPADWRSLDDADLLALSWGR
jgi:hypothetical protein